MTFISISFDNVPVKTFFDLLTASLAPLGALIGGLLSGFPLSKFGRRQTLTISSLLFFFSFLFLGTASVSESMLIIYGSRGILGFGVGLAIPAAQIYVQRDRRLTHP